MQLEVSTPDKEGSLEVSKSRKLPLLISAREMEDLFAHLGSFFLLDVSRPLHLEEAEISRERFLEKYAQYIEGIKTGKVIDEAPLRPFFSSILTKSNKDVYAMALSNGKYLVKARRPVIQLQRHHFIFSGKFHSGVMGEGSVTWGIQFSYPQLFLDPKTRAIGKVEKSEEFPNTELFQRLAKWVRDHTVATPFLYQNEQMNQPIRLGKECFPWINHHPELQERGLSVAARNHP